MGNYSYNDAIAVCNSKGMNLVDTLRTIYDNLSYYSSYIPLGTFYWSSTESPSGGRLNKQLSFGTTAYGPAGQENDNAMYIVNDVNAVNYILCSTNK